MEILNTLILLKKINLSINPLKSIQGHRVHEIFITLSVYLPDECYFLFIIINEVYLT